MEVNEIYCIGSNKFGQAGAGKKYHNQTFATFNKIVFPVFIKQVVCGSHHSGLLTLEGLVYMMGSNMNGTLGTPTSTLNYSYSPVLIENLTDVSKISSGYYHMAAISDGKLYTWGKGVDGQLGTGKQVNCNTPTPVQSFGSDVEQVSCGLNHTLVKTSNKKCYAFGNGIYGQLGIGSNKNSPFPVQVKIQEVTDIAAGQNFSLFLKDSTVYAVGDNSTGQISNQLKKKYAIQPTQIKIGKVTAIRASKLAVAVVEDRKICVWGSKNQSAPVFLNQIDGYIMDFQTGGNLVYCMNSEGELYQWKLPQNGVLDNCLKQSSLKQKTILGFSVGQSHSIILGDIVGQVNSLSEQPLKYLQNIQDPECSQNNSITQSKVSTAKINHQSCSNFSENPSISSQHYSRTPSSIMRQPTNFLKGEAKSIIKQQKPIKQSPKQSIQVTQFLRDKSVGHLNTNPIKNQHQLSECMKKIDDIMDMLAKNNKIEDSTISSGIISRKMTKSYLDKSRKSQNNNKQNKIDKNQKCNRELIMQLRQKQLKISELQQKLSRKDIEIQSQRQLINLLRKINSQHQ